jgi:hypothetical protein
VKNGPNESGSVYTGELSELPSDVRSKIVTPLIQEHPTANQMSEYVCQSSFDPLSFDIHLESTAISHTHCCSGAGGG